MEHLRSEDRPIWDAAVAAVRVDHPALAAGFGAHIDLAADHFARAMRALREDSATPAAIAEVASDVARLVLLQSCRTWEETKQEGRARHGARGGAA